MRYGDYIDETDQIVRAGIMSLEDINNAPQLKAALRKRLLEKLRGYDGPRSFKEEKNKLVKAGIGNEEEWKQLLYEPK